MNSDDLAHAVDEIGVALAALGGAYELLDEHTADRLEEELFRPVQVAYGRAQRTHAGFAERHGLPGRAFEPSTAGRASQGAGRASSTPPSRRSRRPDHLLVEIQDSMMPVEVGDAELRAGLAEARELVGPLEGRAHELVRIFAAARGIQRRGLLAIGQSSFAAGLWRGGAIPSPGGERPPVPRRARGSRRGSVRRSRSTVGVALFPGHGRCLHSRASSA